MKKLFAILMLGALAGGTMRAGSITGTVRAEPKPGTEPDSAGGDKYGSRKYKFAERVNYSELRNFVVCIDGPVSGKFSAPEKPVTVDTRRVTQTGAMFTPHVLPVMVGTRVE